MEDVPNLINIDSTNPIQILNQHEIFWRFCLCPSNDTFNKNKKISMLLLGLNSKYRKSTGDKASISNPKVNRFCAPLTANRTSADCVQISLGPSIPYMYIPLGLYHTGEFNAMFGASMVYKSQTKVLYLFLVFNNANALSRPTLHIQIQLWD